jgi:transcriptional regulator with XRE-family HTH domain
MDIKEIKKLLIDRDISQATIAREIGISASNLNSILQQKTYRRGYAVRGKIARMLGVKVDQLFGSSGGGRG